MLELIGMTLSFSGMILIALSVYLVHNKLRNEIKVDPIIIRELTKERSFVISGIVLLTLGYLLKIIKHLPNVI